MPTITIPKKMMENDELVVIPKKDYERFLRLERFEKKAKSSTEFAIEEGLRDLREGRVSPTFNSARAAIRYLHSQARKLNKSR